MGDVWLGDLPRGQMDHIYIYISIDMMFLNSWNISHQSHCLNTEVMPVPLINPVDIPTKDIKTQQYRLLISELHNPT